MGLINRAASKTKTVGGFTFDWDPINNANDILIQGVCVAAANAFSTARLPGAASGYKVPASKTLDIIAFEIVSCNNAITNVRIGYGDTDVGLGSAAAPTTPVYTLSQAAGYLLYVQAVNAGTLYGYGGEKFSVPTGKYPFGANSAGVSETIYYRFFGKLR